MLVFSTFSVSDMEIFVQPPVGENISIEVETGDTIEAIKEKIFNNNNYHEDKHKLYYNNSEMTNGRIFDDYYSSSLGNIVKMELDSIVNVVLNANGGIFNNNKNNIEIENIITFNYNEFEKTTREGSRFLGLYTKKMVVNLLKK